MRPFSSQDDNNIIQGQEFLVHCLQSQDSPYEKFGESPRQTSDEKISTETQQTSGDNEKNPMTRTSDNL